MAKHMNKGLKFDLWPTKDRETFAALSKSGDIFDSGPWTRLSQASVQARRYGYSQWLGFLSTWQPEVLDLPPAARVTPPVVKGFIGALRRNCTETAVSIAIQRLHLVIRDVAPEHDWAWLYRLQRQIANSARRLPKAHVLSVDLYRLGLALMDGASNKTKMSKRILLSHAERYRDGLMIALLAEAPMRRAAFTELCIGENVVKIAGRWRIYVQPEMVKTRTEQDYDLSENLGGHLDEYLSVFRPVFANAAGHRGMWPYRDRPMTDKMVRRYIRRHTENYLGQAVSPHDFRRAAASFIAHADPGNIRMAKDLLGHRSFAMTEKHYISGANTRSAGRVLAANLQQVLNSS